MIASRNKLRVILTGIGVCVALAVATIIPVGYVWVAFVQVQHDLSFSARIKANRLARYIYVHRELWQYHTVRLAELIEVPEADETLTRQRVLDLAGKAVIDIGRTPPWPFASFTAPIIVAGETVGTIEVAATLRDILMKAVFAGIMSGLLGFSIFYVLRLLQLGVIDRILDELAAAQRRYHILFDANPFPMVVLRREGLAFVAVNAAAVDRYGWSREEFLTMTAADLRPAPDVIPERMTDLANNGGDGAATFPGQRHRKKDGTIIEVEITARAIEFDGEPAALSLAVDVTERNRGEQARRVAEEQLRQSQKMEAVGQLTGGIAHDFNNILTTIFANIDMLQEEEGLGPRLTARFDGISAAVDRAAALTLQLLAFSRKQPLRPQVIDVNELVANTGELMRRSLGAQVEIESVLPEGLWPVMIDPSQLETTLVNLCINARDAMPGGGKLRIETRNVTFGPDDSPPDPDAAAGDYAMLAVGDTGTGMTAAVLAKMFEPFFTTKEVGKGTGLGLSMVYGFIKQSNGHITVQSEPGRGTTVRLYLPRTLERPEQATAAPKPAMPRGSERILVVEDEPEVRANVVEQLADLGYTVSQAADGAAGLAVFAAALRPFDLLLTDVMMPGKLNGKALADAVRHRWPNTRIAFMSGYAENAIIHEGKIDEGVLLLSKPFRKAELARVVREALTRPL